MVSDIRARCSTTRCVHNFNASTRVESECSGQVGQPDIPTRSQLSQHAGDRADGLLFGELRPTGKSWASESTLLVTYLCKRQAHSIGLGEPDISGPVLIRRSGGHEEYSIRNCIGASSRVCREWGPSGSEAFKHCQIGSETIRNSIDFCLSRVQGQQGSFITDPEVESAGVVSSYLHEDLQHVVREDETCHESREIKHDHVIVNEHGFHFRLAVSDTANRCFETGTDSAYRLLSLRRTCSLLSILNLPPRAPAMSSTSSFLDLYEPLDVIGNGSFGIIRKVRRKQDGVVSPFPYGKKS